MSANIPGSSKPRSSSPNQAAGKPLTFEAVLDGDGGQRREQDVREESIRTLADTVGRELLQVEDEPSKG